MKRFFAFALLAFASAAFAQDEPPKLSEAEENKKIDQIIAKARAYKGSEADLKAVKSIHYKGALIYGNGESGVVDIVYQQPLRHQFKTTFNDFYEISTLRGTEAWRLSEHVAQQGARSLEFYDVGDIRQLQAGVREALSFFARPTERGSGVEYVGADSIDGRPVEVLVYYYNEGKVWFRRFFDAETGRLVFTINEKGVGFEETGVKKVAGVRFPTKLVTSYMTVEGEQSMELSYSSIEVNSDIDQSRFKLPID